MTVDELIAREEIRHVILAHFRAADRLDETLERAAFWPDATFIGGPVEGPASEFAGPLINEMLPGSFDLVMHNIFNMLMTVEGDRSLVEVYGLGYHLIADTPEALAGVLGEAKLAETGAKAGDGRRWEFLVGVRYAVEMQRRGTEWRILTMQPVIEWTRVQPSAGIVEGGMPAAMPTVARRNATDATYFGGAFRP